MDDKQHIPEMLGDITEGENMPVLTVPETDNELALKPNAEERAKILSAEQMIAQLPGAQFGDIFPLKHSFAEGVYVREIFIPKGALLVGKIHKHSHPNFLMSGDVSVLTEEGPKRLKGPLSMISKAGTKRVVYAHEDTVWITVHVTNETDLEKIEDYVIAKTYDEYDALAMGNFVEAAMIEDKKV